MSSLELLISHSIGIWSWNALSRSDKNWLPRNVMLKAEWQFIFEIIESNETLSFCLGFEYINSEVSKL